MTHLQQATPRDAEAEKLDKLAEAMEAKNSNSRQALLQTLFSRSEWDITMRERGKKKECCTSKSRTAFSSQMCLCVLAI